MYELTNVRAENEAKRLEIEERRNEDLLQSYLKAKKRRVSNCHLLTKSTKHFSSFSKSRFFKELFHPGLKSLLILKLKVAKLELYMTGKYHTSMCL
jgi:hypothetical protein